jgi:hypothetical protein
MLFTPRISIWALAIAAGLAWTAGAQERPAPRIPGPGAPGAVKPAPDPGRMAEEPLPPLDELIGHALGHNPDIAAARAELHRAEVALRRTELEMVRQLTAHHRMLGDLRQLAKETRMRAENGIAPLAEVMEASMRLAQAEADLAYLLGNPPAPPGPLRASPGLPPGAAPHRAPREAPVASHPRLEKRPELPPAGKAQLQKIPSSGNTCDGCPIEEILPQMLDELGLSVAVDSMLMGMPVSFNFSDSTDIMQRLTAISDSTGVVFVIRDYGFLVTTRDKAERINAPAIPQDTPLIAGDVFQRRD